MQKKLSLAAASLALLLTSNIASATPSQTHDTTQLIVVNNWSKTVHVKEGRFLKTDEDVYSGRTLKKDMLSGFITGLNISYKKNNEWVEIPGCPGGSFYHSVQVYITYAPWDPNLPICRQI